MRRNRPRSVLVAVCFNYPEAEDKRDGNYHIEVSTSWDDFGDMLADQKGDPASWEVDPDNLKEWLDTIEKARDKLKRLGVPKSRHYICYGSSYVFTGPHDFIMQSPGKRELQKWFQEYTEEHWPDRCAYCGKLITDEAWYPYGYYDGDDELCCSEYHAIRRGEQLGMYEDEDEDDEE